MNERFGESRGRILAGAGNRFVNGVLGFMTTGKLDVGEFFKNPKIGGLTDEEAQERFAKYRKTHGRDFRLDVSKTQAAQ
jgi:hypothetical protein